VACRALLFTIVIGNAREEGENAHVEEKRPVPVPSGRDGTDTPLLGLARHIPRGLSAGGLITMLGHRAPGGQRICRVLRQFDPPHPADLYFGTFSRCL
jgi:hypothetical protein